MVLNSLCECGLIICNSDIIMDVDTKKDKCKSCDRLFSWYILH